jgi:hypothetical protein
MISFPSLPDNEAAKLRTVDDLVEIGFARDLAVEAVEAIIPDLAALRSKLNALAASSGHAKHLQLCLLVNGLYTLSKDAFLWTQLTLPLLAAYLAELEPIIPEKGTII